MVTAPEAVVLLNLASGFDNRKPDRETVKAWALALENIDYEDARTAVVNHFKSSSEYLMPADIIAGVRRMEQTRMQDAPNLYELEIPNRIQALDGTDFDIAYREWLQESARRLKRGLPVETGEASPAVDDSGRLAELVASVRSHTA